jgi:hypothetical protein
VAAVEEKSGAIASVELDQVVAPHDVARVVRDRDHEVEDHVIGEKVEEMTAISEAVESFLDDAEERVQSLEVVHVVDRPSRPVGVCWCWVTGWVIHQCCQCPIQWFVERRTKSAKLVGGAPVTLSTALFGREPWPAAMVSVSNRSMSV